MGDAKVRAALADLATAPISEPLRRTLMFLRKVTREPGSLTAADVRPLLAIGVTRSQIEDAIDVAFTFNVITRLADTFQFAIPPDSAFQTSAKILLKFGYKI
jgi:alkylhydroperoxidase family enzyme